MEKILKTISTKQIGDSKLPNAYWVSISNDYYYFNVDAGGFDWVSDLGKVKHNGKTLSRHSTYKEAKQVYDNIYVGMNIDGIKANSITIEDRLSGELCHKTKALDIEDGLFTELENEDLKFTQKEMQENGQVFA